MNKSGLLEAAGLSVLWARRVKYLQIELQFSHCHFRIVTGLAAKQQGGKKKV